MTISKTRLAAYILLAALAGWFLCDAMTPSKSRPVLNFLKRWWWVPLVIEPEPEACNIHSHEHDSHDEHPTPIGSDGFPLVDHRRAL